MAIGDVASNLRTVSVTVEIMFDPTEVDSVLAAVDRMSEDLYDVPGIESSYVSYNDSVFRELA